MFPLDNRRHLIVSIFLVLVVAIAAFFWNEARKEVVYLCGNFKEGVSQASVLNQLDTAILSKYAVLESASGRSIEFNSLLNFRLYKCLVRINSDGFVVSAGVE